MKNNGKRWHVTAHRAVVIPNGTEEVTVKTIYFDFYGPGYGTDAKKSIEKDNFRLVCEKADLTKIIDIGDLTISGK